MTNKCDCYRTRKKQRYVYSRETGQVVDSVEDTVGYCIGTRECDECGCGGDMSKCNFYPEKRGKSESKMADYTKLCEDLRWTGNDYPLSEMIFDISIFDKAADAIEALQAERHNLQVHADYCESERDAYKDEAERLKKKLDAAVADIKAAYKTGYFNDGAIMYDCDICNVCAQRSVDDCDCHERFGEAFRWRGEED